MGLYICRRTSFEQSVKFYTFKSFSTSSSYASITIKKYMSETLNVAGQELLLFRTRREWTRLWRLRVNLLLAFPSLLVLLVLLSLSCLLHVHMLHSFLCQIFDPNLLTSSGSRSGGGDGGRWSMAVYIEVFRWYGCHGRSKAHLIGFRPAQQLFSP